MEQGYGPLPILQTLLANTTGEHFARTPRFNLDGDTVHAFLVDTSAFKLKLAIESHGLSTNSCMANEDVD